MEISFIIPLFNRLDLTRPGVDSLRASLPAGLAHEIILIDDGSSDGTREWAAGLPAPPFIVALNENRLGYAGANNRGARLARGRFLALVNNDLIFQPGWLEPMLRVFHQRDDVGVVGNHQLRVSDGALDHAGIVVSLEARLAHLDDDTPFLSRRPDYSARPAVTGACCLVPRQLFLDLGGFDERYINGGEDVDFCYRARARGLKVLVANRSVVRHHVSASPGRKKHDERNSRRLFRAWRAQIVDDAARDWPLAYLREHWLEPRHADPWLLWRALFCCLGLARRPDDVARAMIEKSIVREERRWLDILGPHPDDK